ncbi:FG-GAP repeat protein, partial [Candidatus Sumerlaeota bacterium]|nr:FG-GAP repeat protein [Candidatus Sumerlaeota bacterium]
MGRNAHILRRDLRRLGWICLIFSWAIPSSAQTPTPSATPSPSPTGICSAPITINNPDTTANDWFGYAVAVSGNLTVVGSPLDDPGGVTDAGTAYVFNSTTGALVATLNDPNPDISDYLGTAVAISGNLAIVGASNDYVGGVDNTGSAFVFNATTGALVAT